MSERFLASTMSSRRRTSLASAVSRRTKASSASRSIPRTTSAMCGMSIHGLKGFAPASRSAASAMFTAWSPIRSRSALIRTAATRSRRSPATGCWVARRWITASSFFTSRSLMTTSRSQTPACLHGVPFDQGLDGDADLALDLRAHADELTAKLLEKLGEVLFHEASFKAASAAAGSTTVNRLPRSGSDSTRIAPPWRMRRCLTMASPSPVPGVVFERDGSTR